MKFQKVDKDLVAQANEISKNLPGPSAQVNEISKILPGPSLGSGVWGWGLGMGRWLGGGVEGGIFAI